MTVVLQSAPVTLPSVQGEGGWQPKVVGLDLSLTSTGVAGTTWAKALRPGRRRSHERMDWLCGHIRMCVEEADLVVVEGAAYAQGGQAGHHELAGLWWLVTQDLWRLRIPYAVANPHHRTIYATGRANPAQEWPRKERSKVAKGMVRSVAAERYGVECDGPGRYDQADATVLAAMGLDWLGYPTVPVPDTHRRALEAVQWPDLIPVSAN
ncbi:hypothetical protein [Streptantibioticus ferralitis]|uniref:RuvC-like resolvase n=1 Tax=Streptantibioticus ferralitis TaxID=236510 RepID=A0ABT5Z068_9ACTN|nr:hypothetical protein [Streptantibioticus ferralitis]MDF2257158.1 hypothetical protein [Streptantibioticus ferralitis]